MCSDQVGQFTLEAGLGSEGLSPLACQMLGARGVSLLQGLAPRLWDSGAHLLRTRWVGSSRGRVPGSGAWSGGPDANGIGQSSRAIQQCDFKGENMRIF